MEDYSYTRYDEENEAALASLGNQLLLRKIFALVATGASWWPEAGKGNIRLQPEKKRKGQKVE